jgi:hypothetical protein
MCTCASSIPPKYSEAHAIGFLKGKSAVRIHRELPHERRMTGLHFWSTGYCVSTVGLDEIAHAINRKLHLRLNHHIALPPINPKATRAEGSLTYLICYGLMGNIGHFRASAELGAGSRRGQAVVIRSTRGVELGEVLTASDDPDLPDSKSKIAPPERNAPPSCTVTPAIRACIDWLDPRI